MKPIIGIIDAVMIKKGKRAIKDIEESSLDTPLILAQQQETHALWKKNKKFLTGMFTQRRNN